MFISLCNFLLSKLIDSYFDHAQTKKLYQYGDNQAKYVQTLHGKSNNNDLVREKYIFETSNVICMCDPCHFSLRSFDAELLVSYYIMNGRLSRQNFCGSCILTDYNKQHAYLINGGLGSKLLWYSIMKSSGPKAIFVSNDLFLVC